MGSVEIKWNGKVSTKKVGARQTGEEIVCILSLNRLQLNTFYWKRQNDSSWCVHTEIGTQIILLGFQSSLRFTYYCITLCELFYHYTYKHSNISSATLTIFKYSQTVGGLKEMYHRPSQILRSLSICPLIIRNRLRLAWYYNDNYINQKNECYFR
jgi:hypothetical protein